MSKTAKQVPDEYVVQAYYTIDGQRGLDIFCPDYDTYAALPEVLSFEGRHYGKKGWNSDYGKCYYSTDVKLAKKV